MKVAVIGAGLSGITAAKHLKSAGWDVTVFEKSRGRGGRLNTKRSDWGCFDMGAQYFTCDHDAFREQVHKWEQSGVCKLWDFNPHKVENGALVSSPDNRSRYVAVPGINQIVKDLGNNLQIRYETRIEQIKKEGNFWCLSNSHGETYGVFHWVIFAIPANQAEQLLAITRISKNIPTDIHSPCWAACLVTKGKVADDIQGIFGDETVRWVSRQSKKLPKSLNESNADDSWVVHFSPTWSSNNIDCNHQQLASIALGWLTNVLKTKLETLHDCVHFWRYANVIQNKEYPEYLVDETEKLAVIGDWCHGGRVEGAYLSGIKLAKKLCQ